MNTTFSRNYNGVSLPYELIPPVLETEKPLKSDNFLKVQSIISKITEKRINIYVISLSLIFFLLKISNFPEIISSNILEISFECLLCFFFLRISIIGSYIGIVAGIFSLFFIFPSFSDVPGSLYGIAVFLAVILSLSKTKLFLSFNKFPTNNENNLASLNECMRSTWGVAGGHVAGNKKFGTAGKVGAIGEKRAGVALQQLTDNFPFVRVFHGVRFTPGKDGPDIDHVVIIGERIFFIDSKYWSHGTYSWYQDTILRDRTNFAGGDVHMDSAMNLWSQSLLRGSSVCSRITLVKENSQNSGYRIDNSNSPSNLMITTLDDLIKELGVVAMSSAPTVNRRLIHIFSHELQK